MHQKLLTHIIVLMKTISILQLFSHLCDESYFFLELAEDRVGMFVSNLYPPIVDTNVILHHSLGHISTYKETFIHKIWYRYLLWNENFNIDYICSYYKIRECEATTAFFEFPLHHDCG